MDKYHYLIELDSELGVKKGSLEIFIKKDRINGLLTLLSHTQPIYGRLYRNGKCKLYGKIVSLIKESEYTATGYINSAELNLDMQIENVCYLLKGTTCNDTQNCL